MMQISKLVSKVQLQLSFQLPRTMRFRYTGLVFRFVEIIHSWR